MSNLPPRPANSQPLQIEVPHDLEIEYVNLVRISHSPAELVFDFAMFLPGMSAARARSRIVMSPLSAKLLYRALGENLAKYEAAFGEIHLPGEQTLADHLFHPPAPPDHNPES